MSDVARVLHVIPDMTLGGAQQIVVDLAAGRDAAQFEVGVVSLFPSANRPLEGSLAKAGVRVWYLDKRVGIDLRMLPRLARVIREFKPHIVHTHCYALLYLLPLVWARRVPPVVHSVHNIGTEDAAGAPWLMWLAYRCGVRPVAVGEAVARHLERIYRLRNVPVIVNGIRVDRYRAVPGDRERVRRELGLGSGDVAFLCAGRFDPQKNHALLLESFRRVAGEVSEARLLLAGWGPLEDEVRQSVPRLGLERSVRLLGERSDMPAVLAAADAFVLSSAWEGNPLALIEAMAAGKAVISTAVGGVPEMVRDGTTGRLVPEGDADALARAMTELARDAAARQKLGSAAAAEAARRFDVTVMVRAYERVYRDRLARSASGVRG